MAFWDSPDHVFMPPVSIKRTQHGLGRLCVELETFAFNTVLVNICPNHWDASLAIVSRWLPRSPVEALLLWQLRFHPSAVYSSVGIYNVLSLPSKVGSLFVPSLFAISSEIQRQVRWQDVNAASAFLKCVPPCWCSTKKKKKQFGCHSIRFFTHLYHVWLGEQTFSTMLSQTIPFE